MQIFLHWNVVYVNREREEGDEGGREEGVEKEGKEKGERGGEGVGYSHNQMIQHKYSSLKKL